MKQFALAMVLMVTVLSVSAQNSSNQPVPASTNVPALQPTTTCTKTLYGPNIFVAYPNCQEAENGAANWLQGKSNIILQSVEPHIWASGDGWENWGVTITYVTGGSCYK